MDRRSFLKSVGAAAGVAVCAPIVVSQLVPEKISLRYIKPRRTGHDHGLYLAKAIDREWRYVIGCDPYLIDESGKWPAPEKPIFSTKWRHLTAEDRMNQLVRIYPKAAISLDVDPLNI